MPNWLGIAVAVVTMLAAVGGIIASVRSHGRTEGVISTALVGIDRRMDRYESQINNEQRQQWESISGLRDELKNHGERISYVEAKINGKSSAAHH